MSFLKWFTNEPKYKLTPPWLDEAVGDAQTPATYPALSGDVSTPVAIVGGGIGGLMTAWNLAEYWGIDSVVIEQGRLGCGSTGKMGSFNTVVIDQGYDETVNTCGAAMAHEVLYQSRLSIAEIRRLIREYKIDCGYRAAQSILWAYPEEESELAQEFAALKRCGGDVERVIYAPEQDDEDGYPAIIYKGEANLVTIEFLRRLMQTGLARKHIRIFENTHVAGIESNADGVAVSTSGGIVQAGKVVFATGAPHAAVPELQDVTRPATVFAMTLRFKGEAPLGDDMYYGCELLPVFYRKLDDGTVLIGGSGRPGKMEKYARSEAPFAKLVSFARRHIADDFTVERRWMGEIHLTRDGLPCFGSVPGYDGKVLAMAGLGGVGTVFAPWGARVLAEVIAVPVYEGGNAFGFGRRFKQTRLPALLFGKGIKAWLKLTAFRLVVQIST